MALPKGFVLETPTDDEASFQEWYRRQSTALGLSPNPDDPLHFYDWRAAYRSGATPDASGHWPSQFKREGHPNLVIDGVDTRTGEPIAPRVPKGFVLETPLLKQQGLTSAEVKRRAAAGEPIVQSGLRTGSDTEQLATYLSQFGEGLGKAYAGLGGLVSDVARMSGPGGAMRAITSGPLKNTEVAIQTVDRAADLARDVTGLSGVEIGPAGPIAEFIGETLAPIPALARGARVGNKVDDVIRFYETKIAATADDAAKATLREEMKRTVASLAPEAPRAPVDMAPASEIVMPHVEGVLRTPPGSGAAASGLVTDARIAERRVADASTTLDQRVAQRRTKIAEEVGLPPEHPAVLSLAERDFDELTGVLNKDAYQRAVKTEPPPSAVSELDVAGVGATNQRFGETHADAILAATGRRLQQTVGDRGTVYRKGGDEFVIHWKDRAAGAEAEAAIRNELAQAEVEVLGRDGQPVAQWVGVDHYYGFGDTFDDASRRLYETKPKPGEAGYKAIPATLGERIAAGTVRDQGLLSGRAGLRGSEGAATGSANPSNFADDISLTERTARERAAYDASLASRADAQGALTDTRLAAATAPESVPPSALSEAQLSAKAAEEQRAAAYAQLNRNPAQRVMVALREAKPLRKEQAAIYSKTRAERAAAAKEAGKEAGGGYAGYLAEKRALAGEMDKIDFQSLAGKVSQQDVDDLFRMADEAPNVDYFDTLTARRGLGNMLEGKLPTDSEIKILRKIYGGEFTDEMLKNVPWLTRAKDLGIKIANIPRSLMSTFDLSAPFRQGVFFVGRPQQFFPAFRDMLKAFGAEDAYKAIEDSIRNRPNFQLMEDSGLALTDLESLATREEAFATSLAEKLPVVEGSGILRTPAQVAAKAYNVTVGRGVRASGRAYTAFLTKLRADVFDDLVKKATEQGLDPQTDANLARQIARFVNAGTGRGDLPSFMAGAGPALNALFFSPKLMASRLTLLNPLYYINAHPFVRKEAVKSLLSFVGFGATLLGLAKASGADVGTNPYSSDFGKIRVGNTRVDVWGGFQQYVRMTAQIAANKYVSASTGKEYQLGEGYKPTTRYDLFMRQVESKLAPVPSYMVRLGKQQDYEGNPVSIPTETAKLFIPMFAASVYELAQEDPRLLPLSALGAVGMGIDTFQPKAPSGPTKSSVSGSGTKSPYGSTSDAFGHDAAVDDLMRKIPPNASAGTAAQIVAGATPYYVNEDGSRVPIPASIRTAFYAGAGTRADPTNTPLKRWLDAMVKQKRLRSGGQLVFDMADGTQPDAVTRRLAPSSYRAHENTELVLNNDPRTLLPAKWKNARQALVGVELRPDMLMPSGEGGIYGMPFDSRQDWRSGVQNTAAVAARYTYDDDYNKRIDAEGSVRQYAKNIMHELAHSAWINNDVTPEQKELWTRHHNRKVENPEPNTTTLYPDDPSHAFVEIYARYVLEPTRLQQESPSDYNIMRMIVGQEYRSDAATRGREGARQPLVR